MRITLFLVFVFSSFLALNVSADQFDEQTSSKIIQEAEQKYKKVLKVKNAWRDTKKIIKNGTKVSRKCSTCAWGWKMKRLSGAGAGANHVS